MGEMVLRAAPGVDLYGVFSTSADGFVFAGTREQVRVFLSTPTDWRGVPALASSDGPRAWLDRADATGTSVRYRIGDGALPGSFDADGLLVVARGRHWFLRRSRLYAYLSAWVIEDDDTAEALLEPTTGDDDVEEQD